ncbi:MAG: preprotein translocase subunit SecG [Spirochaetales bacterium]|nr:preprotein translocase subunit SecG [Spirochaetales bacterium]
MGILEGILLALFVVIAVLLILMVLIQDDQGDGLTGMFGGGSSTTFGSRAGNVLTKTTSILGTLFMILAFVLAFMFKTSMTGDVAAAARLQSQSQSEWWEAKAPAPMLQPAQASTTAPVTSTTAPATSTVPVKPVPSK